MESSTNDNIDVLITRYLTGEASQDDYARLMAWVNEHPQNQRYFDNYKKAFALTEAHFNPAESSDLGIEIDKEWNRFVETTRSQKPVRKLSVTQVWLRAAAAILLVAATAGILFYYALDKTIVHQTAGNTQTVELPDGSTVTLNRFTTLAYEPDFGGATRTINLKGEAFFDVKADAGKPFIVLTEKARVQVLGTTFNVNAYDSLEAVEVIVESGAVSLEDKKSEQVVKLTAGAKGVFSKAGRALSSSVNDDVNYLSWRTQRIVFTDASLRSVIETLRRTYGADITVSTDIPETCVVTVTFQGQSLESVLKVLEKTLNLEYTITGKKVDITGAGC